MSVKNRSTSAIPCARAFILLLSIASGGCEDAPSSPDSDSDAITVELISTWAEMRDCRHSHEHELRFIRVLANPEAELPYAELSPATPYPVGSRLIKLEYDDDACSDLLGYTLLEKLEPGALPEAGDWNWVELDTELRVMEQGALPGCINCHAVHCHPPFGFDLTCAEEL